MEEGSGFQRVLSVENGLCVLCGHGWCVGHGGRSVLYKCSVYLVSDQHRQAGTSKGK